MEAQSPQFTGAPSGQSGSYTFYKGFRYTKNGNTKELNLGDFFFVRISSQDDPCIGELQLLCSNRNNEQQLSALRLYFLPEQTPEGRLSHHGEDEVLVASDRMVLKLEDLVSWITEEVEWNHGILAPQCKPKVVDKNVQEDENIKEDKSLKEEDEKIKKEDKICNGVSKDLKDENKNIKEEDKKEDTAEDSKNDIVKKEMTVNVKEEKQDVVCSNETKVVVLSYQKYCRFRTVMKRIEGTGEVWIENPTVIALGGFTSASYNTRVLFCRENFEHDELAHHELNCEYLAPTIKGKRRKRKVKNARSTSPESNSSEEIKLIELKNNQKATGVKQPQVKTEQEFLQKLFRFMKQRKTPIHRVPHLGFKQIDLYVFYSFAQKLGGYDKITGKRLWKHVYDELGGNPGSTSAATCTRRHYERLLLPFERFMDGMVYKPSTRGKKSKKKLDKENAEITTDEKSKSETTQNASTENNTNDAYNFTDSNHENSNSKDSNSNEFTAVCDEQEAINETAYSDEDSKTVWSIQKQPDNKEDQEEKAIKPLIIQKGGSETFAEKERKWDEIRRKNAAARKWVRQSRSSKVCKTPGSDLPNINDEKPAIVADTDNSDKSSIKIKTENGECHPSTNVPIAVSNHSQPTQDSMINPSDIHPPNQKVQHPVHSEAIQNVINKLENQKKLQALAKETSPSNPCEKRSPSVKSEPIDVPCKSWSGYSASSEHSFFQSSAHSPSDSTIPHKIKNNNNSVSKSLPSSEPENGLQPTGRQSVGSMSISSAISGDTSANEDNKPLLSQRRPSVIQHTEYAATTPSPTPTVSPKQNNIDLLSLYPKEMLHCMQFNNNKMNLPPNQLSYSMTGKVAEWLTKGVHEVVACKTPSSNMEKAGELHDKVMMPSSCKTPGIVGTGKIPTSSGKNKHSGKGYPKSPRSKYSTSHQRNSNDPIMNGNYALPKNDTKNNTMYQKPFHPAPSPYNSVMHNPTNSPKYHQTATPRPEFYANQNFTPYYNQQKRFKCNNMPPVMSGVGTRPSLLPFVRQQTYRPAPLSDIPKTTTSTHNDYDSVVLDLSVKKKPAHNPPSKTVAPPACTTPVPEGVCLDLTVKKKTNVSTDNGIENITPPLPLSPNPHRSATPFMPSTLKPLPTLIAIQDFQSAAAESARYGYSSSSSRTPQMMNNPPSTAVSRPSLVMPPVNAMYPPMTHSKMPQNIVNTMSHVAYSKEIAKSLYMPSSTHHSQFSPYVIPPFFPASWTSPVNVQSKNPQKQTSNSQTSPMTYKGMVNHSVFPKDYPSQFKSQFHPVLCKENGHYPSNSK